MIRRLAWSYDGCWLASASWDGTVIVWNAINWEIVATLDKHQDRVTDLAWNHDDSLLATSSWDDIVIIWDTTDWQATGSLRGHHDNVTSVAWNGDDSLIATASWDDNIIIWNAGDWRKLATLSEHSGGVEYLTWSPDSQWLASVSSDETALVWQPEDGDPTKWQVVAGFARHKNLVMSGAWNPAGDRLATASTDSNVMIWGQVAQGAAENDWGRWEHLATLYGHKGMVLDVRWLEDNKQLITVSAEGTAMIWEEIGTDGRRWEPVLYLLAPEALLTAVVNPSRETLVIGDAEGTIYIVDLTDIHYDAASPPQIVALHEDVPPETIAYFETPQLLEDIPFGIWRSTDWAEEPYFIGLFSDGTYLNAAGNYGRYYTQDPDNPGHYGSYNIGETRDGMVFFDSYTEDPQLLPLEVIEAEQQIIWREMNYPDGIELERIDQNLQQDILGTWQFTSKDDLIGVWQDWRGIREDLTEDGEAFWQFLPNGDLYHYRTDELLSIPRVIGTWETVPNTTGRPLKDTLLGRWLWGEDTTWTFTPDGAIFEQEGQTFEYTYTLTPQDWIIISDPETGTPVYQMQVKQIDKEHLDIIPVRIYQYGFTAENAVQLYSRGFPIMSMIVVLPTADLMMQMQFAGDETIHGFATAQRLTPKP